MSSDVPYILPVGGRGVDTIKIIATSVTLQVEYTFGPSNGEQKGVIEFGKVIAYRFRDEWHGHGFASDSYDTVVKVPDSEWRKELVKHEPKGIRGSAKEKTHFAVFFSSNGYLEVIASTFKVIHPERRWC